MAGKRFSNSYDDRSNIQYWLSSGSCGAISFTATLNDAKFKFYVSLIDEMKLNEMEFSFSRQPGKAHNAVQRNEGNRAK